MIGYVIPIYILSPGQRFPFKKKISVIQSDGLSYDKNLSKKNESLFFFNFMDEYMHLT